MFKKVIKTLLVLIVLGAAALYMIMPTVNIPWRMLVGATLKETVMSQRLEFPEGFRLSLFVTGIKNARFMRETGTGDILLSSTNTGQVYVLYRDQDGDGRSDGNHVLLSELNGPHGLELRDGWLYVAEKDAIKRVRYRSETRQIEGDLIPLATGLPATRNHTKKTIRIGPDDWLYFNVGSSCNVCIEEDDRRATMMRMRLDGSELEIYATGLRNSVGFDWSPRDGGMYATDNGRDLLGDDYPVEELNRIEAGRFYGWPFVNDFGDKDPDFGDQDGGLVSRAINPVHGFRAHNAPLGITFLRKGRYPEDFHHDALVALHGSWNRSEKDGYRVARLSWGPDGAITETDFMTGFLKEGDVIGRPVDVLEASDGAIYISDDYTGSVYRLAYGEEGESMPIATLADTFIPVEQRETFAADTIARGQEIYETRACVGCHGIDLEDNAQSPLVDLAARKTRAEVIDILTSPPSSMPRIPLTEDELYDVTAYLLSASPSDN